MRPELDSLIGLTVHDEAVPTPLVYVDTAVMERNLERMAEAARASGVGLRPHAKTHKIAEIAQAQLDAGAVGLTVAKLGEADALAAAGVGASFLVAQPYVGADKVRQHLDLARRGEVVGCVDSAELARALGTTAVAEAAELDLVLVVDTGYGRLGVDPTRAAAIAVELAGLPGVRFRGIRSHTGHAYGAATAEARREIAEADARAMAGIADEIRAAGVECDIVSVGSTPGTAGLGAVAMPGVTDWRPGNYVFFDRMQASLGSATLEDCALTVVASVVSATEPGRALIDAGKKTLSSTLDPRSKGHGHVRSRPDVEIHTVSEECGWLAYTGEPLRIGDRLRVIPNHACELTNLAERVAYGVDGSVDGFWEPVARARVW